MESYLFPGQDFKEFGKGAEATRENQEDVRKIGHGFLAFVEVFGDDEAGQGFVSTFLAFEALWHDPCDIGTRLECGICHETHEPACCAAVDNIEAKIGTKSSGLLCYVLKMLRGFVGGSAEDTDGFGGWHESESDVILRRKKGGILEGLYCYAGIVEVTDEFFHVGFHGLTDGAGGF